MFIVLQPCLIDLTREESPKRRSRYAVLGDHNPGEDIWKMYARQWGVSWAELPDNEPDTIGPSTYYS